MPIGPKLPLKGGLEVVQEPAHLPEALPYQEKPPTNVEFVGTAPDALAPGETDDSVA